MGHESGSGPQSDQLSILVAELNRLGKPEDGSRRLLGSDFGQNSAMGQEHKKQVLDSKLARLGVIDQKPVTPNSRVKPRRVVLRAFIPAMLGWKEPKWSTVGRYRDLITANARADSLARTSWMYQFATSWTIDGEPYTPSSMSVQEPTKSFTLVK